MRSARGFTLVELLVVLVILGSLVGLAVLSTGIASNARQLRGEAERLASLMAVLVDEAVLDNREYGLQFVANRYQVLQFDEASASWHLLPNSEHRLPVWASVNVWLEGAPLRLGGEQASDEEAADDSLSLQPQVLLLSNGELSPFRLQLAETGNKALRFELSSDGFALPKVEVLEP